MRSLLMTTTKNLTEMQMKLAELLKASRIAKDSAIAIALTIQKDNQIQAFASWMQDNLTATESEMLKKAVQISKEK